LTDFTNILRNALKLVRPSSFVKQKQANSTNKDKLIYCII